VLTVAEIKSISYTYYQFKKQ